MDKYYDYLENTLKTNCYNQTSENNILHFGKDLKFRGYTFKYCIDNLPKNSVIVELSTHHSYVDGIYEGADIDDIKYWNPNDCSKWDWGAGCSTLIFGECTDEGTTVHTIDVDSAGLNRCKIMTEPFSHKIKYHLCDSVSFLRNCSPQSIDLIYMDTGYCFPVEETARLQLEEAKVIVQRDLLKSGGFILIDDVRSMYAKISNNETTNLGKAKYSIPYFLSNGYKLIIDEYQVLFTK